MRLARCKRYVAPGKLAIFFVFALCEYKSIDLFSTQDHLIFKFINQRRPRMEVAEDTIDTLLLDN